MTATITGAWPDSCGGAFSQLAVASDPGAADLRYTITLASGSTSPDEGCLTVLTPFSLEVSLGKIPAGNHVLEVECGDALGQHQPVPVATLPFTVTTAKQPAQLLLHGGRFRVEVAWTDFAGQHGAGRPVPGASSASGLFWFFAQENWELLIKVLDACAFNGQWWVLGAAATNVQYTVVVHDTATGAVWRYENPLGRRSPAILDTTAFACAPAP
ncbi:MAG TPA: hypothetical protein VF121_14950 [Thermoanaerobaculia bacterium]|nr:hypothetical protein [Thermoanaerobaculia bacterium]